MWDISYANLNMLLATIPKYATRKEEEKKTETVEVNELSDLADFING